MYSDVYGYQLTRIKRLNVFIQTTNTRKESETEKTSTQNALTKTYDLYY